MAAMECGICLLPVMLLSDEEHVILYATNSVFFLSQIPILLGYFIQIVAFFSPYKALVFFMRESFINIQESYIFLEKKVTLS
jgi:hypothetical protein